MKVNLITDLSIKISAQKLSKSQIILGERDSNVNYTNNNQNNIISSVNSILKEKNHRKL